MKRGLSLPELLVCSGLLLLLMGLLLSFLYPSFRMTSRAAARMEMQQRAQVALDQMVIDLERSGPTSVSFWPSTQANDTVGVSLQRLETFAPSGAPVWESAYIVYHWNPATGRLIREQWPPALPSITPAPESWRPNRLERPQFLELARQPNGSEKCLADGVAVFEPRSSPRGLRLVLERNVAGGRRERFEVERRLSLRND